MKFIEIEAVQQDQSGKVITPPCTINLAHVAAIASGDIPTALAGVSKPGTVFTLITGQVFLTHKPYSRFAELAGALPHEAH